MFPLDGMEDELAGRFHAGDRQHPVDERLRHPRNLGKRTAGVALDDPQIGTDPLDQQGGVFDQAAVDASHAHHDHQEHPDAKDGQGKAAEVVLDVFGGEVHGTEILRPSMAVVLPSAGTTTRSPGSRPAATSTTSLPLSPSVRSRHAA